jgi:hypothetical protein
MTEDNLLHTDSIRPFAGETAFHVELMGSIEQSSEHIERQRLIQLI